MLDVFEEFQDISVVPSYRSDGIPSELELVNLLKRCKPNMRIEHYRNCQYRLSKSDELDEILLVTN